MIYFTKMHGLGNDFMVLDGIHQSIHLTQEQIIALSQRDTGVGFDQCLIVEASKRSGIDFFYRIFNANGKEVGQCGNGARCLARFLEHYQLTNKKHITVATHTTHMELRINPDETVTVNMGCPEFDPKKIPLLASKLAPLYTLTFEDLPPVSVHAMQIGNPHAVLDLPEVNDTIIHRLGKKISLHPDFPEQVNVGFMHRKTKTQIELRVYERGCGETKACGSGAIAAAAIGMRYHGLDEHVQVTLKGGNLFVDWPQKKGHIFLTGPATFVYEGRLF